MNKYRDNEGKWIGPTDSDGRAVYVETATISLWDEVGFLLFDWHADSELYLPSGEEIEESLIEADNANKEMTITIYVEGKEIAAWQGLFRETTFDDIESKMHDAILNA